MKPNSAPKSVANAATASNSGRAPRVSHLSKVSDLLRESRRIYRLARVGDIETQDLSRLINALFVMANLMKTSDLEARIEALEQVQNANRQP